MKLCELRQSRFKVWLNLYSENIIFFIDHYCPGVSNKHCLLPFFIVAIYDLVHGAETTYGLIITVT